MSTAVAASIQYTTEEQWRDLILVATYTGVLDRIKIESGKQLCLQDSQGAMQLTGINTICRYLANLSRIKPQMLGFEEGPQAQVLAESCTRQPASPLLAWLVACSVLMFSWKEAPSHTIVISNFDFLAGVRVAIVPSNRLDAHHRRKAHEGEHLPLKT